MISGAQKIVRFGVSATVGRLKADKQDRAANQRRIAALVDWRPPTAARLEMKDFRRAGEEHGIDPWKLHGWLDTESSRGGFDEFGHAIMVPECQEFSKRTAHFYDNTDPDLSFAHWVHPARVKSGHPYTLDNTGRWDVLVRQAVLSFDAALESASWGAFQIMGWQFEKLNFDDAHELVSAIYQGERGHLDLAIRLLVAEDGFEALLSDDWLTAARIWNGGGKAEEYASDWAKASASRKELYR